eukprot:COSAG06_NODE_52700_length_304_cov_0.760976_1_plen_34_part_10
MLMSMHEAAALLLARLMPQLLELTALAQAQRRVR